MTFTMSLQLKFQQTNIFISRVESERVYVFISKALSTWTVFALSPPFIYQHSYFFSALPLHSNSFSMTLYVNIVLCLFALFVLTMLDLFFFAHFCGLPIYNWRNNLTISYVSPVHLLVVSLPQMQFTQIILIMSQMLYVSIMSVGMFLEFLRHYK